MRRLRKRNVMMLVDPDFHKKIDQARKEFEKKMGMTTTNTKITRLIAMKGKIKLPKRFDIITGEFK